MLKVPLHAQFFVSALTDSAQIRVKLLSFLQWAGTLVTEGLLILFVQLPMGIHTIRVVVWSASSAHGPPDYVWSREAA